MKPDYKNWMPKGMVLAAVCATAVFLLLFIVFGLTGLVSGALKTVLFAVFLIGTAIGLGVSVWMILMYRAFSYDGKRQMSKQIIEGIAGYVALPDGGKGLDVGCGKKHGTAYGSRLRYYAMRKLIFFCEDEKTGLPAADEGSVGALVCRAKTDIHSTPKSPSPTCRQRSASVRQALSCSAFL